ncbi:hypothetical protein PENARI_c051G11455 [Penicillium arizonense]|uniref:Major facilitator superfamily (MFS) profile domain-containing protein n=1 Tax=Penicillium arizonense TaxID=1835702 RepID=A0A1F5L2U4_PENAI|nr:hypothetical protein PENARI_c051G11455 [Penicillium arizonense]OGE47299.1 hypothetical protein PENARI_c051G11455 [Penicillium arizonense]
MTDMDKVSSDHVAEVGNIEAVPTHQARADIDVDEEYSFQEQRKIIHRVDRRLIIICGAAYCISLMDRTNVSVAAITGMMEDLELYIGFRYSIVLLVLFIPYISLQPLASAVIRYIGPRIFISVTVMTWGACLIGFAYSPNWQTLSGLRAVLGALEAGFFPGTVYLLSCWYSRYEVHRRYSWFYLIGCGASAFSGILAFGFSQMKPLQGLNGWQWIFVMEGVLTFIIGIFCIVFVVDFPDKAHKEWAFLNERDSLNTVTYAIAYFLPIILRDNMGFSVIASQCLTAPPYAFAGILMVVTSWIGDKYHMRAPILIFNSLVTLVGLPIMGFANTPAVRLFGVFLTTGGAQANIPACMAYQANNIRGQWTRAFASATLVGFGGIGAIAGSLIFRSQDAPAYIPGIWAAIA